MADKTNVVSKEVMIDALKEASCSLYMNTSYDRNQFSESQATAIDNALFGIAYNIQIAFQTLINKISESDDIVDRCILCKKNRNVITTKDA